MSELKIAFIIPCLNEEKTIRKVVESALNSMPGSKVYVYDNGSSDETVIEAKAAGALVFFVPEKGKGNVVRRMFADVDADVYVMLDGDGTYEVEAAPAMIDLLLENNADIVTGCRNTDESQRLAYRNGHEIGNRVFTLLVRKVFNTSCSDVLSGYRVMTKRFVKSFPIFSKGFEIEVELTAHASFLNIRQIDFQIKYRDRDAESESKLRTYRDGLRIVGAIFKIFRSYSPSRFFGSIASIFFVIGIYKSLQSLLATDGKSVINWNVSLSLFVISSLFFTVGVVLNAATRQRYENFRLTYLGIEVNPGENR